jgi:hypothetical protein
MYVAVAPAAAARWHGGAVLKLTQLYSLNFTNLTKKKPYASQILSYKIFSFCEQTLKIGANDAFGKMLQYAL